MGQEAKGPMLEWPLSGDAISARGDETLGGLTKPGETARVSGGTCMVQPRDARKIPLTPRGSSVRVPEKKSEKPRANLEGWWVGNQKRARPCGLRVRLSSELPYLSLPVPRYPPWGPLAKVAATAANRPLRGRLGPSAGPAVRLVSHSVRPEPAYPQRYSARRSGGTQG